MRQLAQATENGAPVGPAKVGTTRYPYSAIVLSDAQRHVLDAQLQTALRTKAPGAATPAPTPVPVLGRAKAPATSAEFKASVPPSNDHIRLTWQDTTSESYDKMRISERVGGGLPADLKLQKDQTLLTDYSYGIKERDGAIYALTACNSAGGSAPTTVTFAGR